MRSRCVQDIFAEFRRAADQYGSKTAFWQKHLGLWKATSWTGYAERVDAVAASLFGLVQRADYSENIIVLCAPRPEWPIIELAARAARMTCVPLSPQLPTKQIISICRDLKPRAIFFEATESIGDIFRDATELFEETVLVCLDDDDSGGSFAKNAKSLHRFLLEGRAHPGIDERRGAAQDGGAIMRALVPTPSSAGDCTIEAICEEEFLAFCRCMSAAERLGSDEQLASSSIMNLADFCWTVLRPINTGACVMFGEHDSPLAERLVEVSPTSVLLTGEEWEYLRNRLASAVNDATSLGRWLCGTILAASEPGAAKSDMFLKKIIGGWVLKRMRIAIGLDRANLCLCRGAPVPQGVKEWFLRLGVKIDTLQSNGVDR